MCFSIVHVTEPVPVALPELTLFALAAVAAGPEATGGVTLFLELPHALTARANTATPATTRGAVVLSFISSPR